MFPQWGRACRLVASHTSAAPDMNLIRISLRHLHRRQEHREPLGLVGGTRGINAISPETRWPLLRRRLAPAGPQTGALYCKKTKKQKKIHQITFLKSSASVSVTGCDLWRSHPRVLPVWQRRRSNTLEVRKRKTIVGASEPSEKCAPKSLGTAWTQVSDSPSDLLLFIYSPPHFLFPPPPRDLLTLAAVLLIVNGGPSLERRWGYGHREGSRERDGDSLFFSLPLPPCFLIASILLPFLERPYYHRLSEDLPAVRRFRGRSYPWPT